MLLNINAGRLNYVKDINPTKDVACCVLLNLSVLIF